MEHKVNSWFMPIVTIVAVVVAVVLAFVGSGALGGTPVSEAAGGALSADATPFAPGGPAFSIWSVIYIGLAAYAVYQLLPKQRASARHARLRPWACASVLLNAAWIGVVQLDSLWGSVVVIVVLLAVLIRILFILGSGNPTTKTDMLVTDGTFGLYLGWVTVATTANTAALIAGTTGLEKFAGWEGAAVALLAVITAIGIGLGIYTKGRIAPALSISWGLTWIAVARSSGLYESSVLVWAAGIATALVLITAVVVRIAVERKTARTTW